MERIDQYQLRVAEVADADAMRALAGIEAEIEAKIEERLASDICHALVVIEDDEMVAWAMARRIEPEGVDDDHAPAGWYLMGVVVGPNHRRKGLGRQLTEARLAWLSTRTDCVRYFTKEDNRASVSLHESVGFRRVRDGLSSRSLAFDGGPFTLFALDLD